jgi:hypothetical protein
MDKYTNKKVYLYYSIVLTRFWPVGIPGVNMKLRYVPALVPLLLTPSFALAGEQSKGTLIMMSSLGGWVLLTCGYMFVREVQRIRQDRKNKQDEQ